MKQNKNPIKKLLKDLYNNNALYEAIYCQIVAKNDTIADLKNEVKEWKKETPKEGGYFNAEYIAEKIADLKKDIKSEQADRRQLKKVMLLIFGDDMSEYNA